MCVLWQPHPNRLQVGGRSADSSTRSLSFQVISLFICPAFIFFINCKKDFLCCVIASGAGNFVIFSFQACGLVVYMSCNFCR